MSQPTASMCSLNCHFVLNNIRSLRCLNYTKYKVRQNIEIIVVEVEVTAIGIETSEYFLSVDFYHSSTMIADWYFSYLKNQPFLGITS